MRSVQGKDVPPEWLWKRPSAEKYSSPAMTDPLGSYRLVAQVVSDRDALPEPSSDTGSALTQANREA
ncbi:hypothetical protein LJK88_03335 [Paenibacillus sp. P26]|nr:hypothetical protein LJK88_03335 [Paenibacillus sp. P26]